MSRTFWAIVTYIIIIPVIIACQRIFQSNEFGPGLNIYVFIAAIVTACYLFFRNLRIAVLRDKEPYTAALIHLGGLALIVYLVFYDTYFMLKH